jgi:prevent-host-death family protein
MRKSTTERKVLRMVPALTARTQLGQILKRVRQNKERFVVGRRGEPQAVIMSIEEYLRNFAPKPGTLKRLRRQARSKGFDSMSLAAINLEIARYRSGRRRKND